MNHFRNRNLSEQSFGCSCTVLVDSRTYIIPRSIACTCSSGNIEHTGNIYSSSRSDRVKCIIVRTETELVHGEMIVFPHTRILVEPVYTAVKKNERNRKISHYFPRARTRTRHIILRTPHEHAGRGEGEEKRREKQNRRAREAVKIIWTKIGG